MKQRETWNNLKMKKEARTDKKDKTYEVDEKEKQEQGQGQEE
jgi:hypothetical protein